MPQLGAVSQAAHTADAKRLPLMRACDHERAFCWQANRCTGSSQFLADVAATRASLPTAGHAVNLCQDRYNFIVVFCAVASAGQCNLLPPTRAVQVVSEIIAAHPGSYAIDDSATALLPDCLHLPQLGQSDPAEPHIPQLHPDQLVAIGYTSGSTGRPQANAKRWGQLCASNARNHAVLRAAIGSDYTIVATVPAQHMYGLEMSVLLPLLGNIAVAGARPFFAADIAATLASIPAPRLLVTTPLHLRQLLDARIPMLAPDAIATATAPLPQALAHAAEARFGAPVIELFGSTETCVIAHRRCAREQAWTLHSDVVIQPQPDGTLVQAPYLEHAVVLADLVEALPDHRFRLRGRQADLLEIAGKRASLGDLTARLLAIPGVTDGVVFQLDASDACRVRRIAALAVAPGLDAAQIMAALRHAIDPVFLPRPLRMVAALPRNDSGKLPREALLALLKARDSL